MDEGKASNTDPSPIIPYLLLSCHNKVPRTGGLKQWKQIFSQVLKTKSLRPKCEQVCFFQGSEGESAPSLSPNFWWLLTIFGGPWLVDVSPQSLPASSHDVLSW